MEPTTIVVKAAEQLRSAIEQVERILTVLDFDEDAAYATLALGIDDCLAELSALGIWGEQNRLVSSLLWNVCQPSLSRGWLQNRARTKPRGYAGDYELLNCIYERRTSDEALGRLFDRYFQNQAAPQAVRNRMSMMTGWIAEALHSRIASHQNRLLKVAFMGSALGLEIRDACLQLDANLRKQLHAVLVDMDPDALDFAKQQLRKVLDDAQLTTYPINLFRLPQRPTSVPDLAACDLLFCPGLFDYLNDEAAAQMLSALYHRLNSGGRLIVFQFAPHNPTRAYMEWFANWYLTYRDQSEFQKLIASSGLPHAKFALGAEPLGIDLFATITRQLPDSEP